MMKKLFATILFTAMLAGAMAQSADPVVFEINGKKYHKSQFLKEYLRSIGKESATSTATAAEKAKAIKD